jgi:hypothetical protein
MTATPIDDDTTRALAAQLNGLPQFRPDAHCAKCGHVAASTAHHAAGGVRCQRHGQGRPWDGEHLARTCLRCHFEWAEAVLPLDPATGTDDGEAGA